MSKWTGRRKLCVWSAVVLALSVATAVWRGASHAEQQEATAIKLNKIVERPKDHPDP
jgi:hypothetical protein